VLLDGRFEGQGAWLTRGKRPAAITTGATLLLREEGERLDGRVPTGRERERCNTLKIPSLKYYSNKWLGLKFP
jgi:hypothetical protein